MSGVVQHIMQPAVWMHSLQKVPDEASKSVMGAGPSEAAANIACSTKMGAH